MGKFNILGRSLDTFRNDGFCNRTPDTLAHKDGGKSDETLKKPVNLGSHSSSSGAVHWRATPLFMRTIIVIMGA